MKILFLLKQNNLYGDISTPTSKSGLINSARITAQELEKHLNVETDVRICNDANSIDKEIRQYKPSVVIIEAVWVLPAKFEELNKIYPGLPFIVRVHSEIPFLAGEGEALSRIYKYISSPNVYVAFNSRNTFENFRDQPFTLYLPNLYHSLKKEYISIWEEWKYLSSADKPIHLKDKTFNIGCFGAIRPMKNQLIQAFAAVHFGEKHNSKVRFHINSSRVEQGGEGVLKNTRALFKEYPRHELVEHSWLTRPAFLQLVKRIDLGMQLSFNESFNIVTADFVYQKTPIVVSSAIDWMPKEAQIDSELIEKIVRKMEHVLVNQDYITKRSTNSLVKYNKEALLPWKQIFT